MYKGKFISELSLNEVKEYYDELRQKCPRTGDQWTDFNLLKERLIAFAYKLLDGKTNGDVIKALFPNAAFNNAEPFTDGRWETIDLDAEKKPKTEAAYKPTQLRTYADWWNAPNKAERKEV